MGLHEIGTVRPQSRFPFPLDRTLVLNEEGENRLAVHDDEPGLWRSTWRRGTFSATRAMRAAFDSLMSAASRGLTPRHIASTRTSLIPARYERWRPFVVVKARTSCFAVPTN